MFYFTGSIDSNVISKKLTQQVKKGKGATPPPSGLLHLKLSLNLKLLSQNQKKQEKKVKTHQRV